VPQPGNKADRRDNNFNLLRMIAAGAVLVSHAYPISLGMGAVEPLSTALSMSLGTLALVTFFVISGFFISQSFENRSGLLAFCVARVLRIYPGLLVVLLFTVLVIGPIFTRLTMRAYFTDVETISYVPYNLSLKWLQYELPGVFTQNPYPPAINGSLWSLFYEVVCYGMVAAVGALGLTGRSWKFCIFLTLYVLIYFGLDLLLPSHNYLIGHPLLEYLHELTYPFVLGMVVYHFRRFLITNLNLLMCAGAGGIALLSYRSPFFREAFVLFWTLLIFYLGYLPFKPLNIYNRVGDYSYGMYIYAFPCEQIGAALWPGITPIALIAVSLPATLAFSTLSWHLIERRALAHRATAVAWLERNLALINKEQVKASGTRVDPQVCRSDRSADQSDRKSHRVAQDMPSLYERFRGFLASAPNEARMIGWRWVITERILKRLRIKEIRLKPKGLDRRVSCRVATSDIYEYQHLLGPRRDAIDLPLRAKVIVDAGANVGYSVLRFRLEFPDALIIALEPEPANITQFKKNCGGDKNIILEEKALWSTNAQLRIRSLDAAPNGFQVEEDPDGDLSAMSVSDLLAKYKLPRIDLLKIDVEGSEKTIFQSPETAIWLERVEMILIETHDRIEAGCSQAVAQAVASIFDSCGHRGEYSLYVRRP
jgi:FkbM family methyltransferase